MVQLPYRLTDLVAAKFAAVIAAWLIVLIPVLSALVWWQLLGGHLDMRETATLILGHLLYALLIGAISFLAAALTEGGATAAPSLCVLRGTTTKPDNPRKGGASAAPTPASCRSGLGPAFASLYPT